MKFSWALLLKEYKPIFIGMGIFLILLFFEKAPFPISVVSAIFYFFLLIISIFDVRYGLIFDKILLYFSAIFFIIFLITNDIFPPLSDGFSAAFLGALFFILIQIISKNGVGGGDIKFIFCLGLWLGCEKLLLAIYISVISAFILVIFVKKFRKKGAKIPFGVFLSLGAIISFMYGEKILRWYEEYLL